MAFAAAAPTAARQEQQPGLAQLGVETWRTEAGLGGNWVRDIVEGNDGLLWVATPNGLSRFDGRSFANFSAANTPALPQSAISAPANAVSILATARRDACANPDSKRIDMHRRQFLTQFPVGLAGAVASALGGGGESRLTPELRPLLESAESVHWRAQTLYHEPWRWGEIRELLSSATSNLAQAWPRSRGITEAEIRGRPARGDWFFAAGARRDEDTRIPWRQMHLHMARMRDTVDHIEKFYTKKISLQMRAQFIEDHRRLVRAALDTNALCLEGVRREVLHRLPADQVIPGRVSKAIV